MKTEYIAPAIAIMRMAAIQTMMSLSIGDEEGDGEQLSKMTPFMEPEEPGDVADEYFDRASVPSVEFRTVWTDE